MRRRQFLSFAIASLTMPPAIPESYSVPSGEVLAGGHFRLPAWLRNATVGQWGTVGTALNSVNPAASALYNADYPSLAVWCRGAANGALNYTDSSGVFGPWCGAVWDEDTKTYWLPLGGGHGDYAGNESYREVMSVDSPTFELFSPPSGSLPRIAGGLPAGSTPSGNTFLLDDGLDNSMVYADGRLRAIHNYRRIIFVPGVGIVMTAHSGVFRNVAVGYKTYLLNPVTREWDYKCERTAGAYGLGSPTDGASCHDPSRDCVWHIGSGSGNFWKLTLATWTWQRIDALVKNTDGPQALEYIGDGLLFYANEQLSSGFRVVDPEANTLTAPGISNVASGPTLYGNTGMVWVEHLGSLVVLDGNNLFALTPGADKKTDAWTWSQLATSGTLAVSVGSGGVLGKFVWSPTYKTFLLIRNATTAINFLRLE